MARARQADWRTLTFFSYRTVGAAEHVRRLVAEGWLGQVHQVTARYLTASHLQPGKPAQWRMKKAEAGTGVLGDLGSHLVDLVRWWLGDFARVAAQWQTLTRERRGEVVDADESVSFLADLACGAQATFHASKLASGYGNWVSIELHGSAGTLVFEADTGFTIGWAGRLRGAKADRVGLEVLPLPADLSPRLEGAGDRAGRDEAYRRLTDPFFASLAGGPPATPDFSDGAAVQAVLDAVAASAESGRWVDVERV
ncbi:MAG: Gfo/Idh/MocA family oxidoreductase [Anaeromyxobacteraceae bacterium]